MAPPVILESLDRRTNRTLRRFIERRLATETSWRRIAIDILRQYDVDVDPKTVQRWYELGSK
jgi:hypothetical protein